MINLVLPVISSNRYWRPVRIGNHITIVPTKDAKDYKATVKSLAFAAGVRNVLLGRLQMTIRLYPHRPLDWAKRARKDPDNWTDSVRCIDLGNCEKVLSDALNGVAWLDDNQLHEIRLIKCDPDERGERADVTICKIIRQTIVPGLL